MSNTQPTANAVATIDPPRIPYPVQAQNIGIDESSWQTLVNATFPTAKTAAGVMLALSYCKARNLDVFKRPVHIVPINTKKKTPDGKEVYVDIETVWPGINELRITAFRTGAYAGCDPASFGPDITKEWPIASDEEHPNAPPSDKPKAVKMHTATFPEWCQVTVYRLIEGQRVAFPGPRVYWLETYATMSKKSEIPNQMWQDRARGQIEKCAEAAALRKAFPEELASEYTIDEAPRRMVDVTPQAQPAPSRPDRTEIERKERPRAKADTIQYGADTQTIIHKADEIVLPAADAKPSRGVEDVVEVKADAKPDAPSETAAMSEALDHALTILPKLSLEEISGAKATLKDELSEDEYRVWHTAALERHRQLKGRK